MKVRDVGFVGVGVGLGTRKEWKLGSRLVRTFRVIRVFHFLAYIIFSIKSFGTFVEYTALAIKQDENEFSGSQLTGDTNLQSS